MSVEEQKTVSYRNTYGDLAAFAWRHNTRQPIILVLVAGFIVMSSLTSLRMVLGGDYSVIVKIISFIVLETLTLVAFFLIFFAVIFLSNVSRMNKSFLTEHTVTVDPEGFTETTEFSRGQSKWLGIQKVVKTKSYLLLYVSQHSAHFIPKRAFDSDESWESFCSSVTQFRRQST